MDLDPARWREIEAPLSMSFKGLHDAIQAAFHWWNMHLWEFDFDGRRYGPPYDDDFGGERVYKASIAKLTRLRDTGAESFPYTYDMGDNWEYRIDVLELFDAGKDALLPRFVAGRWRAPPEDVGGVPAFEAFLEAMADPNHPDRAGLFDWYGGPFDPEGVEEDVVRVQLDRRAKARIKRRQPTPALLLHTPRSRPLAKVEHHHGPTGGTEADDERAVKLVLRHLIRVQLEAAAVLASTRRFAATGLR